MSPVHKTHYFSTGDATFEDQNTNNINELQRESVTYLSHLDRLTRRWTPIPACAIVGGPTDVGDPCRVAR